MSNTTDTNQASELHELCKEVYKRFPEWNDTDRIYGKEVGKPWRVTNFSYAFPKRQRLPLYTSDYLLDRMPEGVSLQKEGNGYWTAMTNDQAEGVSWYEASAKSPLKALLKLVIALDDAGQLKGEE